MSTVDDIYELDFDFSEVKPVKKRQKRTRKVAPAKPKPKLQVDREEKPVLRKRALPAVVEENSRSEEEEMVTEDERPRSKKAKPDPKPKEVVVVPVEELSGEEPSPGTSRQMDAASSSSSQQNVDASPKIGQTTPLLKKVAQKLREQVEKHPETEEPPVTEPM